MKQRFDFSEVFSGGVIYAEPMALASFTAWSGLACLAVIGVSAVLLFAEFFALFALTWHQSTWVYGALLASSLIFLMICDLARIALDGLKREGGYRP